MNTEITEYGKGWVFYDAECQVCRGWVERTHALMAQHGCHPVPLQSSWARTRLGLGPEERLTEMKFLAADGRIFGGADALLQIARAIWWAWPLYALARISGVRPVLRMLYRHFAARRHCTGQCLASQSPSGPRLRHLTSSFYELP